jgi:hypothetical protein
MVVTPVLAQNMTAGNATGDGNVTGGNMTSMAKQQQPTLEGRNIFSD